MQRKDRNLYTERERECGKKPELLRSRQWYQQEIFVSKCRHTHEILGFPEQEENSNQHEKRPKSRIQEKLYRGIDPSLTTPYTNNEVHRYERKLEEDIEKEDVRRYKDTDHSGF